MEKRRNMKVLVVQMAFLGDAVISLSLAEELRRLSPYADITYLVRPEVAPMINLDFDAQGRELVDKYGAESGSSGVNRKAAELNALNFDLVITLHTSRRTLSLIEKLKAPRKIGYSQSAVFTDKLKEENEPRSARAVRLIQTIFPEAKLSALPVLQSDKSLLPLDILQLPRPVVLLAPDSVWATKQWGYARYTELMLRLSKDKCSIVVTGTTSDKSLEEAFKILKNNTVNLLQATTLPQLAAIVAHSDLVISNDSATAHIATATGTRSLVIFGPTVPEFGFAPPDLLGKVIEDAGLWCRPCSSHGSNECPIHTHDCMANIPVDFVFKSAIQTLGA
ncbi:MAG: glycosyltransferase family 9 protein [Ignavibacteriota bacterium]